MKALKTLTWLMIITVFFLSACGSEEDTTTVIPDDEIIDPSQEDPSFDDLNFDGTPATISDIAVGFRHAVLLLSDGTVWASGDITGTQRFVKIYEDAISISVLQSTTAVITTDGTLYTFPFTLGAPDIIFTEVAQNVKSVTLGTGTTPTSSAPIAAYIKNDNTLWLPLIIAEDLGLATNQDAYQQILTDVKSFKFDFLDNNVSYLAALKNDGTLWETVSCCGTQSEIDAQYPINDGFFYQVLSDIAAIDYYDMGDQTTAVTTTGELFVSRRPSIDLSFFGFVDDPNDNSFAKYTYKQYPNLDKIRTTVNGPNDYFVIDDADNLYATGGNGIPGVAGTHGDGSTADKSSYQEVYQNVAKVASDNFTTFILLNDGTVKATGGNSRGQFGDGTTTNKTDFDEENGSTGSGGSEDLHHTWELTGSSMRFDADGTGEIIQADLTGQCSSTTIPIRWSSDLSNLTITTEAYTICEGHATYEFNITEEATSTVQYEVSGDILTLNPGGNTEQKWTKR